MIKATGGNERKKDDLSEVTNNARVAKVTRLSPKNVCFDIHLSVLLKCNSYQVHIENLISIQLMNMQILILFECLIYLFF